MVVKNYEKIEVQELNFLNFEKKFAKFHEKFGLKSEVLNILVISCKVSKGCSRFEKL